MLNRYLYLTGRVDMKAIELTVQHLLRNGFDPHTGDNAYRGLIYTSFQERATKVSHSNVAQLALRCGAHSFNLILPAIVSKVWDEVGGLPRGLRRQ